MKNLFVILASIFISILSVKAQDIITMKSGDELNGKILRLNPKNVLFSPKGIKDTVSISREDVVKLRYQSGTIVNLTNSRDANTSHSTTYDSMYYAGVEDARKYYIGYKGASSGTLVAGLAFPFNIIPAIACSITVPQEQNLSIPDSKLSDNPAYKTGYKNQAHKIKKQKVWKNYAIGSGVVVGFYILLSIITITSLAY